MAGCDSNVLKLNNENCLIKFIMVVVVATLVGAVVAVLSHHISNGSLFYLPAIICRFPPLNWHVLAVS
jgi:hypothetical protein